MILKGFFKILSRSLALGARRWTNEKKNLLDNCLENMAVPLGMVLC